MISYFPVVTGSLTVSGSVNISGGITASGGISISGSIASASFASTASFVALAQSASNAVSAQTASFANTLTVAGNLTAQTLVVQTITSSVDFVTGSTRFGSILDNTHVFSGSVTMNPGGLFVSGSGLVGIGTTSPTNKLNVLVDGGGNDDGILIGVGSQGDGIKIVQRYLSNRVIAILGQSNYSGATDSGALRLYDVDGTETVRLSGKLSTPSFINSGNIGIGTNNPQSIFHIGSPAPANSGVKPYTGLANSYEGFLFDYYYNTSASNLRVFDIAALGASTTGIGGSDIRFLTVPQTTTGTPLERLRIVNSGNVGVGTSSPQRKFVVSNGGAEGIEIGNSSGYNTIISYNRSTSAWIPLVLQEGTGNVLIGTTSNNGSRLQVDGAITATSTISAARAGFQDTTGNNIQVGIVGSASTTGQGNAYWNTFTKFCIGSSNNTLIIPFVDQGNLNSTTICRVTILGAYFNSNTPSGSAITFQVGHLSALYNFGVLSAVGNYSSATTSGMQVRISLASAHSQGCWVVLEYLTNLSGYSINTSGVTLN
jgi:hypothetical protein